MITHTGDMTISNILTGTSEDQLDETRDYENSIVSLNAKEIYLKIAQNIELINLYTGINEQIILNQGQNILFR